MRYPIIIHAIYSLILFGIIDPIVARSNTQTPINSMCPILTDEPIELEYSTTYENNVIGLCCEKCKKKFIANPTKYLGNIPAVSHVQPEVEIQLSDQSAALSEQQEPRDLSEQTRQIGKDQSTIQRTLKFLGSFHPLVVHFPIALVFTLVFIETLNVFVKREWHANMSRLLLAIALFFSVIAAGLGWLNAEFTKLDPDATETLFRHRWLGISGTLMLVATTIFSELSVSTGAASHRLRYKLLLFVSALIIGITGHLGGVLVFGSNYFKW